MKKFGVLCLLVLLPVFVRAQSVDPADITNIVTMVVTPETPSAHQSVTASIEAYGIDLSVAHITWRLNGSVLKSGQGLTSVVFSTGDAGTHSLVTVAVTTSSATITQSIDIVPGSVDLAWQGNTYAPPFYKGRTYWTHQSRLTLVALAHIINGGAAVNPQTLTYRWSEGTTVMGSASGVGKSSYTLTDTALSLPRTISVDVLTNRTTVVGTASITLTPTDPEVLVYENNPLYGLLFNREVGNQASLLDKEVTFSAIPYFFSGSAKRVPSLSYRWATNGTSAEAGDKITYRAPDSASGSSKVGVTVTNTNTILQSAEKTFLVQFGQDHSSL